MNRIKDLDQHNRILKLLETLPKGIVAVGLTNEARKIALAAQLVDSIRRIEYLNALSARSHSANLHTPYSGSFEPLGGGAALLRAGRVDDSYWLTYLATHFGKHKVDGWNLAEDFYGRFGQGGCWNWEAAKNDPNAIEAWFVVNYPEVTSAGRSRRFSNHRKFETLKPGPKGTGNALRSYVDWINKYGSHEELIASSQKQVGQNPKEVFAHLYRELDNVSKLGRLGKFDLLCNWSNLMIAPIYPDRSYIAGSTGPKVGAKLLFGHISIAEFDVSCIQLAEHLNVSAQAIEDALCNWQKSPELYIHFRG